ncbi:unnamed protein product [Urochloa decumbens]|uniref:Peptidase A1 domain-containing protein n=1 Tax=Urochloa decumbens TaxID=240449 RepID=A0ABC9E509_9POAL
MQAAMVDVLPLLLLILLGSSPTGRAADDEHEEFTVLDLSSLKPHAACTGHRVTPPHNGSWVPLYRPHGPCSPWFRGAAARAKLPSLAELLRQDQLRVRHIHRKASGGHFDESKGARKEPVTVEETQVHHQAAISVQWGTQSMGSFQQTRSIDRPAADDGTSGGPPAVAQTVVLDTGSDVPWVECVPCALAECPYYDPARSSTYLAFPCNSTACKQLGPYANGCVNSQCQYRVVSSIDGSVSSGTYSSDVLTINSGNSITSFKFGCNTQSQNSGDGGPTNGVMALGRGAQSLTAQTSSTYGDAFSYCLPQKDYEKGFFRIGVPSGAAYRFAMTPLLRDRPGGPTPSATVYRVRMVAVTVNGQPLNVAAEAFAAGTVVDSVTVITRLPLTVYGALRAAFRDRMAGYRRAPPQDELDTCYDLTGVRFVKLPRIALVFDGNAAVEIDRSGILLENGCLAFAANDDDSKPAVLGNTQQKTIEVLHDVGGGNMGFRRLAC